MAWSNFLRKALPIAAGVLGSPALGAVVGGAMGMWGAHSDAKAQERAAQQAGQTAMGGSNYFASSPVGQQYVPGGGEAFAQQRALLGLGGDQDAANRGYQNYLASTGYQGQLQAGTDGIMAQRAAAGAMGSGSTLKALQAYGTQLGQQNFSNYFSQLGGMANMGLQGAQMVGGSMQQGAGQAAGYQYGAGVNAAGTRHEGWNELLGGLGEAYDHWQTGRTANAGMARIPSGRIAPGYPRTPQIPSMLPVR